MGQWVSEWRQDTDIAAGLCLSRKNNQDPGDSEPWALGTGWPILRGRGHRGGTPGMG